MFTHLRFILDESNLTQFYAIVGMTNKHEWLGTSGLKQLLLMLVGFIYLLWQWQVMQRIKGFSYRSKYQICRCCPNAVKESRSERVGFYRNEQGGFAYLALLKIAIALHRCQRPQRRNNVHWEGTNTGKQEGTQSMPCNNMMHDITWQNECVGLMHLQPGWFELIWTKDSNANSSYGFIKCINMFWAKQQG